MLLPKLKVLQDADQEAVTCAGKDYCSECKLFEGNGGRCEGCTSRKKETLADNFRWCYRECGECAGHKVHVPAICCRSPMSKMYLDAVSKGAEDWNKPVYSYTQRPQLNFKNKAVFYISSGGVNTIAQKGQPLIAGNHEVAAVNLTRVWGGNGFYSKDMKDYLHLSKKTKLILMTMTLDDLLQRAWDREAYGDDCERVGIDYWMPLSFSAYPEEAHMHQYFQTLRTLYATEKGKAWFTTGDHCMPGLKTDDLILKCAEKIPQVVFNAQFVDDDTLKFHLVLFRHYHQIMPKGVSFWFVGAASPTFFHNVRKMCGKRDLYFVSAKPFYLSTKGQELKLSGSSKPSSMPKYDLVQSNYQMFSQMVEQYGGNR